MAVALHCNLETCDTWAKIGQMTDDWISVYEGERCVGEWCCVWHMIIDLSKGQVPPKESEIDLPRW